MQKRVGNSLRRSGFTVVELLIVIVVIAILAAITVVAYNGVRERSMTVKQLADLNAYIKIIEAYKINKGLYPPSTQCLSGTSASYPNVTSGSVPSPAGACYFTSGFSDGYTQSETDDLKAGSEIASLPTINASVVYYKSISYESSKGILYTAPADRLSYDITIPLLAKYVTCDSVDTSDDGRVVLCRYDPSKPIPRMK